MRNLTIYEEYPSCVQNNMGSSNLILVISFLFFIIKLYIASY